MVSSLLKVIIGNLLLVSLCSLVLSKSPEKRCVTCSYQKAYYLDVQQASYSQRDLSHTSICTGNNPCGTNAVCHESSGRPVCSCSPGYRGNPMIGCTSGECLDNVDCVSTLACKDGRCINPCIGVCGFNANCDPRNHVAVCSCPLGFEGDPFTICKPVDPEEQCHPSPCGQNTKCEILNGVPTCSCLNGFSGDPLSGCRHECDHDDDCSARDMCSNFKCVPACQQCGTGASCNGVANHRAVCECPKGYIGSPYTECRPECSSDADCPLNRPACLYGICKNTCDGACGVGAVCHLKGLLPVCACPIDMTGDPTVRCQPSSRSSTKDNLCEPNPCAMNAFCTQKHDKNGVEFIVCNCLPGYLGNGQSLCTKGDCLCDDDCPDNKACISFQCVNPCIGKCGTGASCMVKAHLAGCVCQPGFSGDALVSCRQSRSQAVAKYTNGCSTC